MTIRRVVPKIRTDRPAETRDFFVDLFRDPSGRIVNVLSHLS